MEDESQSMRPTEEFYVGPYSLSKTDIDSILTNEWLNDEVSF